MSDLAMAVYRAAEASLSAQAELAGADAQLSDAMERVERLKAAVGRTERLLEEAIDAYQDAHRPNRLGELADQISSSAGQRR